MIITTATDDPRPCSDEIATRAKQGKQERGALF